MTKPKPPRSAAPGGSSDEPTSATLTIVAPGTLSTDADAEMGEQLTAQYRLAVGGMVEVLKFGVMMMQLVSHLDTVVQVRTTVGQFGQKSQGSVEKWLLRYAPDVKRATAYRFMHVAESICEEYEAVVGAKIAKKYTFPELVTASAQDLPQAAVAKQLALFDYVSGTSQRSWLDRFKPPGIPGGAREKRDITPEQRHAEAVARYREQAARALSELSLIGEKWHFLPDEQIEVAIGWADEFSRAAKAWIRTPKRDRVIESPEDMWRRLHLEKTGLLPEEVETKLLAPLRAEKKAKKSAKAPESD